MEKGTVGGGDDPARAVGMCDRLLTFLAKNLTMNRQKNITEGPRNGGSGSGNGSNDQKNHHAVEEDDEEFAVKIEKAEFELSHEEEEGGHRSFTATILEETSTDIVRASDRQKEATAEAAREAAAAAVAAQGEKKLPAPKANLMMMHSKLICCKIYISESRNTSTIAKIDKEAWSNPDVVVLSEFGDYFYNRVRYTLISYIPKQDGSPADDENPMKDVVLKMVDAAIANIDLNLHTGAHPRMGVIDDVSFHPLGDTKMQDAAQLAQLVASEIGDKGVPVFLYGEAHPNKMELGKIRRELGYFRPDSWWPDSRLPDILMRIKPDKGPTKPTNNFTKLGATTVGAAPFLEGYNVPLRSENVTEVKDIVTKLRKQLGGGNEGLPKVLAIALPHGDGIVEVACLLDPNHVSANLVQDEVRKIAAKLGLGDKVEKGYYTDITKDMILVNLAAVHHQPAVCNRACQ